MSGSCLYSMQDNYLKGSVKHHCSCNVASYPNSGVLTYFGDIPRFEDVVLSLLGKGIPSSVAARLGVWVAAALVTGK